MFDEVSKNECFTVMWYINTYTVSHVVYIKSNLAMVCDWFQQKTMESEEYKEKIKTVAVQALSRLEKLKVPDPTPSAPPPYSSRTPTSSSSKDLLSELDNLPLPPKGSPRVVGGGSSGIRGAATPRGVQSL